MPETERLMLRRPRLDDADAFAAINADPEVVRFISHTGPLFRGESDLMLRKMIDHSYDLVIKSLPKATPFQPQPELLTVCCRR